MKPRSMTELAAFFRKDKWPAGDGETVSGRGSTLAYTANLRADLPKLIAKYGVGVLLDAPCGDFNWMSQVDLKGVGYIGMDIVPELVEENVRKHSNEGRRFVAGDITRETLPAADLMLCRDCLFHLCYDDIVRFFANFVSSGIPYLLLTTHRVQNNRDIDRPGRFRRLNMRRPPFEFPEPLEEIEDWIEGFPERSMGLWTAADIRAVLLRMLTKPSMQDWYSPPAASNAG
jgi:hypothetical protein